MRPTQQEFKAKVYKHMDEASLIRLRFSLLEIAEGVASVAGYRASRGRFSRGSESFGSSTVI